MRAMSESPADKPSIPSIRFMALFMNTIVSTVNGAPMKNGMSCIPKRPYRSLIYNPESGRILAAMIWKMNLVLALSPRTSSTKPTVYMIIMLTKKKQDHRLIVICPLVPTVLKTDMARRNAAIMLGRKLMPPRRGMPVLCIFRAPGKSYSLRFLQKRFMMGMNTTPHIKLTKNDPNIYSIYLFI